MDTIIRKYTINTYIKAINNGEIRIPTFQRKYRWNEKQVVDLLDSIYSGFPINSFILWKSNETIDFINNFGDYTFKKDNNSKFSLILDGQQRSLSLFGLFNGITVEKFDFKNFYINVRSLSNIESKDNIFRYSRLKNKFDFSVYELLTQDDSNLLEENHFKSLDLSEIEVSNIIIKLMNIKKIIKDYQLNVTETFGEDLLEAPIIFEKINKSGTKLTTEDIIFSKLYFNHTQIDFNFSEYLEHIENKIQKFWGLKNTTLKRRDVINIITTSLTREKSAKSLEIINIDILLDNYKNISRGVSFANKFLKDIMCIESFMDIPRIKLIYTCLIIFYINNDCKEPSIKQIDDLTKQIVYFILVKDNVSIISFPEVTLYQNMYKIAKNKLNFTYIDFGLNNIFEPIVKMKSKNTRKTDIKKTFIIMLNYNNHYYIDTNYSTVLHTNLNRDVINYYKFRKNPFKIDDLLIDDEFLNHNFIVGIDKKEIMENSETYKKQRLTNLFYTFFEI